MIPRNRFRQPMWHGGPVRQSYSYSVPSPPWIVQKFQHWLKMKIDFFSAGAEGEEPVAKRRRLNRFVFLSVAKRRRLNKCNFVCHEEKTSKKLCIFVCCEEKTSKEVCNFVCCKEKTSKQVCIFVYF